MKTYFDCIPCFTRQALDTARFASDDINIHEAVLRKSLESISKMDMNRTPPEMGAMIYRIVKEVSGNNDPFREVKRTFNNIALDLYPELVKLRNNSTNPFEKAVRFAIAGNIIDFGVGKRVDKTLLFKTIDKALSENIYGSIKGFEKAVSDAKQILYIGDNSGEIVFDRILIEHLLTTKSSDQITFVVRGEPVINDITMDDAVQTGMTKVVNVIDTGLDLPGVVIEKSSIEFQKHYNEADLVIAKGQGNYETLSGSGLNKNIFFLLKAKCEVVAGDLGCDTGRSVVGRVVDFLRNDDNVIS